MQTLQGGCSSFGPLLFTSFIDPVQVYRPLPDFVHMSLHEHTPAEACTQASAPTVEVSIILANNMVPYSWYSHKNHIPQTDLKIVLVNNWADQCS